VSNIWCVIAHFNPASYRSREINLRRTLKILQRQNARVLVVEAVFRNSKIFVEDDMADAVLLLHADAILWQKERLLNIGIESLPASCEKIVWLDSDIAMTGDDWLSEVDDLLDTYAVVQPYSHAYWMSEAETMSLDSRPNKVAPLDLSAALAGAAFSEASCRSEDYPRGHTGFAWAARRDVVADLGLYDRMIVGGADSFIAAAFFGLRANTWCSEMCTAEQKTDIQKWMNHIDSRVRRNVGYRDGILLHMWHGARELRQYRARHRYLLEENFSPVRDICIGASGCWSWSSKKYTLHKKVRQYFLDRREG
jgi:hypothetical protein